MRKIVLAVCCCCCYFLITANIAESKELPTPKPLLTSEYKKPLTIPIHRNPTDVTVDRIKKQIMHK